MTGVPPPGDPNQPYPFSRTPRSLSRDDNRLTAASPNASEVSDAELERTRSLVSGLTTSLSQQGQHPTSSPTSTTETNRRRLWNQWQVALGENQDAPTGLDSSRDAFFPLREALQRFNDNHPNFLGFEGIGLGITVGASTVSNSSSTGSVSRRTFSQASLFASSGVTGLATREFQQPGATNLPSTRASSTLDAMNSLLSHRRTTEGQSSGTNSRPDHHLPQLSEKQSEAFTAYWSSLVNSNQNKVAIENLLNAFNDEEINKLIASWNNQIFLNVKLELVPPYIDGASSYSLLNGDYFNPKGNRILLIVRESGKFFVKFENVGSEVDQSFADSVLAPYLASAILKNYRVQLSQKADPALIRGEASIPCYTQQYKHALAYILDSFTKSSTPVLFGIERRAFAGREKSSLEGSLFAFTKISCAGAEDLPNYVKTLHPGELLDSLKIEKNDLRGKVEVTLWIKCDGTLALICDHNKNVLAELPSDIEKGLRQFVKSIAKPRILFTPLGKTIIVSTSKKALKACPKIHLTELNRKLKKFLQRSKGVYPRLHVLYSGHDRQARDGGGVARDFLSTLFEGLIQSYPKLFLHSEKFGTVAPITTVDPMSNVNSSKESKLFSNIGKLLMYCLQSPPDLFKNKILTGRVFDDALFKAIQTLDVSDISYARDTLHSDVQSKTYQALLEGRKDMGDDVGQLLARVKFVSCLNVYRFSRMSQEEIKKDPVFLEGFKLAETHNLFNSALFDSFNKEKNLENFSDPKYVRILFHALYMSIFSADIVSEKFFAQIEPVHAIALGMLKVLVLQNEDTAEAEWAKLRDTPYLELSAAIQGNIDRLQIANFEVNLSPSVLNEDQVKSLEKKTIWLQEWLVGKVKMETGFSDEDVLPRATNEEVRRFLIFATGSSSLPKGKQIIIQHQNGLKSLPKSHTCIPSLEISPDFIKSEGASHESKEEFIECVKEAIHSTEFGFE